MTKPTASAERGQGGARGGTLLEERREAIIIGPIETQFGYYVFDVDRVKADTQQTLEEAKSTIKQLISRRTSGERSTPSARTSGGRADSGYAVARLAPEPGCAGESTRLRAGRTRLIFKRPPSPFKRLNARSGNRSIAPQGGFAVG
jgi:hypothetical protein